MERFVPPSRGSFHDARLIRLAVDTGFDEDQAATQPGRIDLKLRGAVL